MSFLKWVFSVASLVLLSGCASISMKEHLVLPGPGFFPQDGVKEGFEARSQALVAARNKKGFRSSMSALQLAYKQVNPDADKLPSEERKAVDREGPLPGFFVNEKLVQKLVRAAVQASTGGELSSLSIDKDDVDSFARVLNQSFLATDSRRAIGSSDANKKAAKLVQQYLSEYYSGDGFVDREGAKFKRPEIKNSIGNDVITAAVGIALEAVFDSILESRVYYTGTAGKEDWHTSENRKPTVLKINPDWAEPLATDSNAPNSITAQELKGIRYISGLAADRSKVLSGAAYRAIGGVDLGIVIAGKFSIGDNDTLAKMLDTTFEVAAKRIAEEVAVSGFLKIPDKLTLESAGATDEAIGPPARILLKQIEAIPAQ